MVNYFISDPTSYEGSRSDSEGADHLSKFTIGSPGRIMHYTSSIEPGLSGHNNGRIWRW